MPTPARAMSEVPSAPAPKTPHRRQPHPPRRRSPRSLRDRRRRRRRSIRRARQAGRSGGSCGRRSAAERKADRQRNHRRVAGDDGEPCEAGAGERFRRPPAPRRTARRRPGRRPEMKGSSSIGEYKRQMQRQQRTAPCIPAAAGALYRIGAVPLHGDETSVLDANRLRALELGHEHLRQRAGRPSAGTAALRSR